jgi:murein DD-endopeptidase MepM/ murein hydrolase activator NlpD
VLRQENQLAFLEIGHPGLAGEVRRQEALDEPRKRANVARFGQHGLKLALGRKNAVESGKSQGDGVREGRIVQIILISGTLAKARPVTLTLRHLVGAAFVATSLLCAGTAGLYWVTLRYAAEIRIPVIQQMVLQANEAEAERGRAFVQENLNAMAVKLGEMQAQLTRLDALGERLSSLAGFRPQDFRFSEAPGLGGAAPTLMPPQNLSLADFSEKLTTLARNVETRNDLLGVLEAQLFEQAVKKKLIPTMMPVSAPYNASAFGRRVDPFTGQWAMHEGIDFLAEKGSPIVAAADGVVVFSGFHPQYGYMVDIDHGNDLVTRYAHQSRLLVKEGEVVQRGRKIGEAGSTGRSTGPHLHFEVRYRGVAQNPMKFLVSKSQAAAAQAK